MIDKLAESYLRMLPGGQFPYTYQSHLAYGPFIKQGVAVAEDVALAHSQFWPSERIQNLQGENCKKLVEYSVRNVNFWQDWLKRAKLRSNQLRSLHDLQKVPIINKAILRAHPSDYFTSKSVAKETCKIESTSGSTGQPYVFPVDTTSITRRLGAYRRLVRWAGYRREGRLMRISIAGNRIGLEKYGSYFFVGGKTDLETKLPDIMRLLKTHNEWVVEITASVLLLLAEYIEKRRMRLPMIKSFLPVSEGLAPDERLYVEQTLETPLFNFYAARDIGYLGAECEHHRGLHINPEAMYMEIVDQQGNPCPPGNRGRVVVTVFDNLAMPLIRYDTGDFGVFATSPCPCGRTSPLLTLEGRAIEYIRLPHGDPVHVFRLFAIFNKLREQIETFQIHQKALGSIVVHVIPTKKWERQSSKKIQHLCEETLSRQVRVRVQLDFKLSIPPSKKRKILISDI